VPVAVSTPAGHDVGGIVGHMLEHQRAVDDLLQGLIVPSATHWKQGAERLRQAALLPDGKMPSAAESSAEAHAHAIAKQAEGDADSAARAVRYAQIVGTCADCHKLHSQIWGPTRGR
jgi:nitrate/TMAO reductase-like tetraheme cytochrome c subunit